MCKIDGPLGLLIGFLLFFATACSGTGTGTPPGPGPGTGPDMSMPPPGRVPVQHRPSATKCDMTRPPGPTITGIPGTCTKDSDCTDMSKGQNGRCVVAGQIGAACTYDTCFDDSTCSSKVCLCRQAMTMASSMTNHCLTNGNCRVDADCGAGGYCSPSFGSCGSYSGVVAYYCHTSKDKCIDDSDCNKQDGGGLAGYCAYDPASGAWGCSSSFCSG